MSQTALAGTKGGPRIGRAALCVLVVVATAFLGPLSWVAWAFLLDSVGYDWVYVFGLAIPILNIVWLCRWSWRLVNRDNPYWIEQQPYTRDAPPEVRYEWETRTRTPYEAKIQAMRERGQLP